MDNTDTVIVSGAIALEQVLEALGTGYLAPPRDDVREKGKLPRGIRVISDGLSAPSAGSALAVCEVPKAELVAEKSGSMLLPFPVPIGRVTAFLCATEAEAATLQAQAESFSDLAPESTQIRVYEDAESKAPRGGGRVQTAVPKMTKSQRARLSTVDKVGGAIAALLVGMDQVGQLFLDGWEALKMIGSRKGRKPIPVERGVIPLVLGLLPAGTSRRDRELLQAAVNRLALLDPSIGFDRVELLGQLLNDVAVTLGDEEDSRRDVMALGAGLRGVLTSQLELKPDSLTDSGSISARALLVFLLNPSPEMLDRFMSRRHQLGPRVTAIARVLGGLYNGLALLPAGEKAKTDGRLAGIADLALAVSGGSTVALELRQSRDPEGRVKQSIRVGEHDIIHVIAEPPEDLQRLLRVLRRAGLDPILREDSDVPRVTLRGSGATLDVDATLVTSHHRLPAREVVKFSVACSGSLPAAKRRALLKGIGESCMVGPVWADSAEKGQGEINAEIYAEPEALPGLLTQAADGLMTLKDRIAGLIG